MLTTWPTSTSSFITLSSPTAPPQVTAGKATYYFGENGQFLSRNLCTTVAVELADHGIGNGEPTAFTEKEHKENFIVPVLGCNSRCKAFKARALGWKPKYGDKELFESVKQGVSVILEKELSIRIIRALQGCTVSRQLLL